MSEFQEEGRAMNKSQEGGGGTEGPGECGAFHQPGAEGGG